LSTTPTAVSAGVGLVCQTVPAARVPELDKATPGQVWAMPDGETCALGYRLDGHYWMEWPDFATFRFHPAQTSVTAFVQAGISREAVDDVWRRGVLPLVLVTRGLEGLHASAVAGPRGIVALCATSGTGKSTLAYALRARGFQQWADDAVVFDPATASTPHAIPLPYSSRIDFNASQYVRVMPEATGGGVVASAALAGICVLSRLPADDDRDVTLSRLSGSEALLAVLPHAHVFDQADLDRTRRMVDAFLSLVDRVPVHAVQFRPGPEAWPAVLDRVAGLVAALVSEDGRG
jgi:hypothetical protein